MSLPSNNQMLVISAGGTTEQNSTNAVIAPPDAALSYELMSLSFSAALEDSREGDAVQVALDRAGD